MKIVFHKNFKKNYQKRIKPYKNLKRQFEKRFTLFQKDQNNPILKNHSLRGELEGYFSFSITGDIRVVYQKISSSHVIFLDIGTHNQVY